MNRSEFIQLCRKMETDLKITAKDYYVTCGGSMILHGLRAQTDDIDATCKPSVMSKIDTSTGTAFHYKPLNEKCNEAHGFAFGDFELHVSDVVPPLVCVDGVWCQDLESVVEMKQRMGREKDLKDVEVIQTFLSKREHVNGLLEQSCKGVQYLYSLTGADVNRDFAKICHLFTSSGGGRPKQFKCFELYEKDRVSFEGFDANAFESIKKIVNTELRQY